MKTFFSVKFALLPFVVYWAAAGFGWHGAGAALGAAIAAAMLVVRLRTKSPWLLEAVGLPVLALLAVAHAIPLRLVADNGVAWSFLALGLACSTSVAGGRPWTGAYAAAAWGGASESELFRRINGFLSTLWAAIFLYIGTAMLFGFPASVKWLPVAVGAVISIGLPPWLARRALARQIAARERYPWPVPDFAAQAAQVDADVAVVGAGLGGLVAAALLAQSGLRVVVVEQHDVVGGFCHTWLRKGKDGDARPVFRFDGGVHDVSGCRDGAPVHGVLQRLGLWQAIDWRRLGYREVGAEGVIDVPPRWDEYVEQTVRRFPAAADGLRRAMAEIAQIFAAMYSEAPARSGIPGAPDSVEGMLAYARRNPLAVRWLERPFREFLASHLDDPNAIDALCTLSGYVTDDVAAASVMQMVPLFGYYLHGGYYPAGGSGVIAEALAGYVSAHGGRILLRTAVTSVAVEDGRARGIRLEGGEVVRASAVVMNADFIEATRRLVDASAWPDDFRRAAAAAQPACSAFLVQLGVRGGFPDVPPILHLKRAGIGIVIPSQVDPGAAPEGYSTVEIIRLLRADEAARWFADPAAHDDREWRRSDTYLERKRALGDEMLALAEEALPGLRERVVFRCEASPATFRRYEWTETGAIYGSIAPREARGSRSPIPGLVFAGAVTHGAGVEAVFISGALAAQALVPGLLATPRRH